MIKIKKLFLQGVLLLECPIYNDKRGSFIESYNFEINKIFKNKSRWVQDNESVSNKNVFRGLHFQKGKYAQSKLLRVSNGKILDIIFDLRMKSSTFGKYIITEIDSRNKFLYIPKGLAHGFFTLTDNTILNYRCDEIYNQKSESGINPFKSNLDLGINFKDVIMSDKDKSLPSFSDSNYF